MASTAARLERMTLNTEVRTITPPIGAHPPPKWRGELYLQLHQGTLTSQALTKRLNRECENRMRLLEALLVYASFDLPALPTIGNNTPESPGMTFAGKVETKGTYTVTGKIGLPRGMLRQQRLRPHQSLWTLS